MDFASGVSSRICIGCDRLCIGCDGSATAIKLDHYPGQGRRGDYRDSHRFSGLLFSGSPLPQFPTLISLVQVAIGVFVGRQRRDIDRRFGLGRRLAQMDIYAEG